MEFKGVLKKMKTQLKQPIEYYLEFDNDWVNVNQLLEKKIRISFDSYQCLSCGSDQEIFRQGFCKSCFFEQPQAGDWIMRPELSTAHLGKEDRDLEYEKKVQLQPHIVYLANSSHLKVGVTRKSQIPTRWIDQGAHEAIEVVEVPNRYLAGITEVALKNFVDDKTNWRAMLTNNTKDEDLVHWKEKLTPQLPNEVKEYLVQNNTETHLEFPVHQYPEKVKSLNLKKQASFEGILKGIKGQYFIFDSGRVFNVRSHEGFVVKLELL
jgi:hypothetical protein